MAIVDSTFDYINGLTIDNKAAHDIFKTSCDLKNKGKKLDSRLTYTLKNIVEKALKSKYSDIVIVSCWADSYESTSLVKIKVILSKEIYYLDQDLKDLNKLLKKDIRVKEMVYGLSDNKPTLIIWM